MKLSEWIHEALVSRILSKFHKVRTVQLKGWQAEAAQLESQNAALLETLERIVRSTNRSKTCTGSCNRIATEAIRKAKEM